MNYTPQHRLGLTAALLVLLLVPLYLVVSVGAAPIIGGTYWQDEFTDATGISAQQGVTVAGGLVYASTEPFTWTQSSQDDFISGDLFHLDASTLPGDLRLAEEGLSVNHVLSADAAARQSAPAIAAAPDGTLYAVWEDLRDGQWNLYLSKSTDGGVTWSANRPIRPTDPSAARRAPDIVAGSGGKVYVVWEESAGGTADTDIMFASSADGGTSWATPVQAVFDVSSSYQRTPVLALDSAGTLYVAWEEQKGGNGDIYVTRSTDGGAGWGYGVRVNDDSTTRDQTLPTLVAGTAGHLYLAWSDARNGNDDIYFASSTNSGQSWSTNVKVNSDIGSTGQTEPSLARDGLGNLHLAWRDLRNGDADIYYARSTNGGANWQTNRRVNQDDPGALQYLPAVSADDAGRVFVSWRDNRDGAHNIYAARSEDGGAHWLSESRVNDDAPTGSFHDTPVLTFGGGQRLALVWRDSRTGSPDIYGAVSNNRGGTWGTNFRLNDDGGVASQYRPVLAIDGGSGLHVAWQDFREDGTGQPDADIYYAHSTDGGLTWSADVKVSDDGDSNASQSEVSLAVSGTNAYLAWRDTRGGDGNIYFASSANGVTWSANRRVNDDSFVVDQGHPSLAADALGHLYLAWQDRRQGHYDIYFATSTNGGATWSANTRVNQDSGTTDQTAPSLAVSADGGQIFVAWQDGRNGNDDVYFARSADGGSTWAETRVNDDGGTAAQGAPSLAWATGGTLHLAWRDARLGGNDIYYARSTNGGTTWSQNARVNDDVGANDQDAPRLAAGTGGNVFLAWEDRRGGDYDIYVARSTDAGQHWSANENAIAEANSAAQHLPSGVLAGDGNAFLVWQDDRRVEQNIYFSREGTFYASGTFTSRPFDTGWATSWGTLSWANVTPAGTTQSFASRTGPVGVPGASWSTWSPVTPSGTVLPSPLSRYVQVRTTFTTTDRFTTPLLSALTLGYTRYSATGVITSVVISPSLLGVWDSLRYTTTVPLHTSMQVDVLSAGGAPLLLDVASGASLSAIDATAYPQIRLRATLHSSAGNATASLDAWEVTWSTATPTPTATATPSETATPVATASPSVTPTGEAGAYDLFLPVIRRE
ncbi:MAG: exo-alpha-sialidase [Chloroflexi bacterium]|nr:exo-alpha-sialidase [Chloroflexota bacterium]